MQRIGRFTVVRELGHGGMGSVYLAKDPELERDVAIKLLHRTTAGKSSARAQFREEARALARMSHSGIVTIFETGEHEGQQFIAMEYLHGRSLRDLLGSPEAKPPRERLLAICADVARAVAAAHGRGILHRDIKPENVVVGEGVKVVDFGLARRLGVLTLPTATTRANLDAAAFDQTVRLLTEAEEQATIALATIRADRGGSETAATAAPNPTVAGTIFGTPAYMAPEVLQGAPASEASDVYSLGVMLYECLGGRRPYEAGTLVELIARVIDGSEPPKPLADPMWPLVAQMLSRDSDQRPGLPEIADRLVPSQQIVETPRKRWPLVAGAGAAIIAVGFGAIVSQGGGGDSQVAPSPPTTIAIDTFVPSLTNWGFGQPSGGSIGDIVARLIIGADGIRVITPIELGAELVEGTRAIPDVKATARRLKASFLVEGKLVQSGDQVTAEIQIVDLETGTSTPLTVAGSPDHHARLLVDVAERVAATVRSGATLDRKPDRARARSFLDSGRKFLETASWNTARPYLEQAVETDPSLLEGWTDVATVRGWTIAPQPLTVAAIDTAIRIESDDRKRKVWIGAAQFYRNDLAGAIATLAPLANDPAFARGTHVHNALLFYLGDALWHDGQPAGAMVWFRKLLERDSPITQARAHAREYVLGRREFDELARYETFDRLRAQRDLARGEYQAVIDGKLGPFDAWASILAGKPLADFASRFRGTELVVVKIASATARDDAERTFATAWPDLRTRPSNTISVDLTSLQEVLLVAELPDAIRDMIAAIEKWGPRPFGSSDRAFPILAAPILEPGKPATFSREGLTSRQRLLATAIEAELAGNRVEAVRILGDIVREPLSNWEYPERAALIRNLVAVRRFKEATEHCTQVLRPAVFRHAWQPLARTCRKIISASSQ